MTDPERIGWLLYSKRRGELSADEETELMLWRQLSPENEKLFQDKMDPEKLRESMIQLYQARDRVFEKLKKRRPELANAQLYDLDFDQEPIEAKRVWMSPIYRRAGIGILVLSVLLVIVLRITGCMHKMVKGNADGVFNSPEGIENLFDEIYLGWLSARAHIELEKNDNGEYDYLASGNNQDKKLRYTVSSAEKGDARHFRLRFPDSTWSWVSYLTWIKYPRNFSQDTIHISLDGAAYFECKRDSVHPYIISLLPMRESDDSTHHKPLTNVVIEASTAHFDINAYSDSTSVLITAITGSLFIGMDSTLGNPRSGIQLLAGQQAEIKDGKMQIRPTADVNKILSRVKWYAGK